MINSIIDEETILNLLDVIRNNPTGESSESLFKEIHAKNRLLLDTLSSRLARYIDPNDKMSPWRNYIIKKSEYVFEASSNEDAKSVMSLLRSCRCKEKTHAERYLRHISGSVMMYIHDKYKSIGVLSIVLNSEQKSRADKVLLAVGPENVSQWWPDLDSRSLRHIVNIFDNESPEKMIKLFPKASRYLIEKDLGL